jgi:transposase InsO family protein
LTCRFLADHAQEWPAAGLCDAPGVSESGYHAGAARAPSEGGARRGRLVAATEVIRAGVEERYGSPRLTAEWNARGHARSENPTAGGWLYLAVAEDLFRRRIVGWATDGTMTSRLVVGAPGVAARRRLPGGGWSPARTGGASTRVPTTRGCSGGTGSPAA